MTSDWPILGILLYALSKLRKQRTIDVPVPYYKDPGYKTLPLPVPDWVPEWIVPTPSGATPVPVMPQPAAWPAASSAKPSFPGPGWEYDVPPPPAVVARANELLSSLWKRGEGTNVVEQTGGRWIAYVAKMVASGKRGVVAFRQSSQPSTPSAPSSSSPGWPQPSEGAKAVYIMHAAGTLPKALNVPNLTDAQRSALRAKLRAMIASGMAPTETQLQQMATAYGAKMPPKALRDRLVAAIVHDSAAEWLAVAQEIEAAGFPANAQNLRDTGRVLWGPHPGAPAQPSAMGMPTLRKGAGLAPKPPNDHVKLVQKRVGATPDGRFGSGTEAAVKAFQRSHGLTADGVVGPKTWAALYGAAA